MNTAIVCSALLMLAIINCLLQCTLCIPTGFSSAEDADKEATDVDSDEEDSILQKRETPKLSSQEKQVYVDETQLSKLPGEINPCNLVPEKGNCKENITRYYYDDLQKNCLPLQNMACASNENYFGSLSECEDTCIKARESRKASKVNKYKALKALDVLNSKNRNSEKYFGKRKFPLIFCSLQRDNGLICPGIKRGNYLNQYYFDEERNRCIAFVFNGCGGNANRFSSMWECTAACEKKGTKSN